MRRRIYYQEMLALTRKSRVVSWHVSLKDISHRVIHGAVLEVEPLESHEGQARVLLDGEPAATVLS